MPRNNMSTQNLRRQVAIEAARLMVEQGIDDFRMAKRKAAERLGMREQSALPSNLEVETALFENRRLFARSGADQELAALRDTALTAMRFFESFKPRLVGATATGALTATSVVELHLFTDSVEAVAMRCIDYDIEYKLVERRLRFRAEDYRLVPVYCFEIDHIFVEAYVFSLVGERQSPLSPVDAKPMSRISAKELVVLMEGVESDGAVNSFLS